MHEQKHIVETVKTGIIESIRGTGEVVDAAIDTVSGTLVHTLKSTGAVGAALLTTDVAVTAREVIGVRGRALSSSCVTSSRSSSGRARRCAPA